MKGGCLCGQVRFEADPPLREVIACHCSQCRKTSGHFWAATSVPKARFHLESAETLRWYEASQTAQRGFCGTCGSFLFWEARGRDEISFAAGALDGPTGLQVAEHWHLEDAGDYYSIEDGAIK